MDQEFVERLIQRRVEPLEKRLRDLEIKLQGSQAPQGPDPKCPESTSVAVDSREDADFSLVTEESDDEPTCLERILCRRRLRKGMLALSPRGKYDEAPEAPTAPNGDDEWVVEAETIDADVYGITLVSLIENSTDGLADGVHFSQLILSCFLLLTALALQVGLLYETKHLVTPHPVADIRDVYDKFEIVMYGNNTDRMQLTANGKHRGYPEYFQPELFNTLSPELQGKACRIPFSQPLFFFIVCFVWSAQCISEIKHATYRFRSLIWNTRTSRTMRTVFRGVYPASDRVIQELTLPIKSIICVFLLLPRFLITGFLLWLGSRWLAATDSFAGLVWNVVALEFVLNIKVLIYDAMSPIRANFGVLHFRIMPVSHHAKDNCDQLYGTLVWTGCAVLWVLCYMRFFQQVVPDYRWDVHGVCTTWIDRNIAGRA